MTTAFALAAALLGQWGCEAPPIYLPTTPASTQVPPATRFAEAEVAEVAAETEETAALAVTENVAAEQVLEPTGLSLPALNLGHLALDWGVGSIGAGTLMPTPGIMTGGGGFFPGRWGGGGFANDPGGSSSSSPVIYNVIYNSIQGSPGPNPNPIPEPSALLVWAVVGTAAILAGMGRSKPRRDSKSLA